MSEHENSQAEGEVKSFHLADKEHSFKLRDDETEGAETDEEVKSFHLASTDHSFKKE
jgi:hypothetical protein